MNITQLLNNNCFSGRNGLSPLWLILHATAGGSSAQEIAQYFKNTEGTANPVSAHYVIGQDGQIYQCNNEADSAWGNGVITGTPTPNLPFRTVGDGVHRDDWWSTSINPNYQTVSIEHVKPDNQNTTALTPAQQTSSLWLVNDICTRNNIPKRFADANGGVTGHFSIDVAVRSLCPNTYPWDELWAYLANGANTTMIDLTNPTVASHFSGTNNTMWKCTNGFVIGHAILDFYRKFGGDALCGLSYAGLPLSNELPIHGYPGVVQQEFERCALQYDANKVCDNPPGSGPVYVVHTNQDLRTVALQDEITTLQQMPAAKNLLQINTLASQIVKLSAVQ